MSAYVVDDLCINRILSKIADKRTSHWTVRALADAGYLVDGPESLQRLGAAMRRLNVRSVVQRYGPEERDLLPDGPFAFVAVPRPAPYQALKSLMCFTYQCHEGTIPQTKLYRAFETIENAWARELAMETPEFQAAEWG